MKTIFIRFIVIFLEHLFDLVILKLDDYNLQYLKLRRFHGFNILTIDYDRRNA